MDRSRCHQHSRRRSIRPDELSVEQATIKALTTWNREPMFHLSSSIEGWDGPKPERHHDFIDVNDFPACWRQKKDHRRSRSQGQGTGSAEIEGRYGAAAYAQEVSPRRLRWQATLLWR